MGRIGNQPPRPHNPINWDDTKDFLHSALEVAELYGITLENVLKARQIQEQERTNNITIDDGDNKDEHIAGICDTITGEISIARALFEIADALKPHP